jgi:inward rectifier potassium channel
MPADEISDDGSDHLTLSARRLEIMKNRKFNPDLTTGFGARSSDSGRRFYRKDGEPNIKRKGVPFLDAFSWFHTWLAMKKWKFWITLCSLFVIVSTFFAVIYYSIGVESLVGVGVNKNSKLARFAEAFFFSAQTLTTVGYGHITPNNFLASSVAAFEAFLGVLYFALASGLFYGRFSMPRPYLYFSDIALIGPYKKTGRALMFRTAPYKNNNLTDAEVKLTLAIRTKDGDTDKNEFYSLPVEFNKINILVLNWTVVHPITEESPLFEYTKEDLKKMHAEILVFIKAYDEVFANTVVARTSYIASEIIFGAKFKPMYQASPEGTTTILDLSKLNDFERVETP